MQATGSDKYSSLLQYGIYYVRNFTVADFDTLVKMWKNAKTQNAKRKNTKTQNAKRKNAKTQNAGPYLIVVIRDKDTNSLMKLRASWH